MATIKLTSRDILVAKKQALATAQTVVLWDSELKGFGIRLSPKGRGNWVIKSRLGLSSKQVWFGFGDHSKLELDDARKQARELLTQCEKGIDPSREKRTKRATDTDAYLNGKLRQTFNLWFEKHADKPEPETGSYWYEVRRRFNVEVFPKLGEDTPVKDITKQAVMRLIDEKEKLTKSGARQVFNALNPFFKWCVSREIIPTSPMLNLTPPENPESRDRVLDERELKLVYQAAQDLPYPWGPYYQLLLLTAQRRDEVANMLWPEVNLSLGEWIIPKERTKNNKEHLVHLSPLCVSILSEIERKDSPFVFTHTLQTPISGFSKAKKYLDALTTIEKPWRLHDLRRTAATNMAMLKVPPHVIERILNHVSGSQSGVQGIYQRFEYATERKNAIYLWNNHVSSLTSDSQSSANVLLFAK